MASLLIHSHAIPCAPGDVGSDADVDGDGAAPASPPADSPADKRAKYGVLEKADGSIHALSDDACLGRLFAFDKSIKAVCARHKRCVCWINCHGVPEATATDAVDAWLSDRDVDLQQHRDMSKTIKIMLGMCPK
eukprot:11240507-Alexandrium_andersonii.AAC.1